MAKVIGFENKLEHRQYCNKCKAIIAFNNSDIIRDDMGCEIICPNCGNSIKF